LTVKHPILAVISPEGMTLVIGRTQARLPMTPQMMRWKAIELLKYAEEAERQQEADSGEQDG